MCLPRVAIGVDRHVSHRTALLPGPPTVPTQSCYATVYKERKEGRMVEVVRTLVFGAMLLLGAYLERSPVRATINTAFVERNNGTDRHQDARKRRQTCGPSMDIEVHHAASYLIG